MAGTCAPKRRWPRDRQRSTTISIGITLVVATLALTACSRGTDAGAGDDTGQGPEVATSSDARDSAGEPLDSATELVGTTRLPARAVGKPGDFGDGLEATVTDVERLDVEAVGPHETAGPAVAVSVALENTSDRPVDLVSITLTATGPDGEVGIPVTSGSQPLAGALEPGERRTGTYVFRLDRERSGLSIDVYSGESENIVVVHT